MIFGGLLVGGLSRRMGHPKAEILFEGRRMDAIAVAALSPHCDTVVRLGPDGLVDSPGVAGPLAGIMAARAHAPEAWWVIAACDMPLLAPDAVRWLLDARSEGDVAVVPRTASGGPQPTLALYGPGVDPLLAEVSAPIELVGRERVASPLVPEALSAAWTNVNRPEDLAALRRR